MGNHDEIEQLKQEERNKHWTGQNRDVDAISACSSQQFPIQYRKILNGEMLNST